MFHFFFILSLSITLSANANVLTGTSSNGKPCQLTIKKTTKDAFYNVIGLSLTEVKFDKSIPFFFNNITATEFYLKEMETQNPELAKLMREHHRFGLVPPVNPEYKDCAFVQSTATSSDVGPWGVSKVVSANLCLDEKFKIEWLWMRSNELNINETCQF